MKAIIQEGKVLRVRRGKLVEVPPEWVGVVVHDQTRRKRASHQTKAQRQEQRKVGKSGFLKRGLDWRRKALERADKDEA